MSLLYSFMDDSIYGADDINNVFSKLTTQGVSLFNYTNGDNPLVSLNNAVAGFVEPGIDSYNIDSCKVTYNFGDNSYKIGVGNAFMYDGSSVTIDAEPYDITAAVKNAREIENADVWVCFYRNIPSNRIDVLVETNDTKFNSQYSVPLAKITTSNTVVDMRQFAKTKLAPCSANVIQTRILNNISLSYGDPVQNRKRAVFSDIFPGATKVFMKGLVHDIQRVDSTNGNNLVYSPAKTGDEDYGEKVAFNWTGEKLEVWMYISYSNSTVSNWEMIVF